MSNDTPIRGLDPKFICEACQEAAADKAWDCRHAVESVCFTYCDVTQTGLTLFSWHGRPLHYTVFNPAYREASMRSFVIQRDAAMHGIQRRLENGHLRIQKDGTLLAISHDLENNPALG